MDKGYVSSDDGWQNLCKCKIFGDAILVLNTSMGRIA